MVFRFDYGGIEVLLKLLTVSFHQKGGFLMKQFKKIFSLLLSFCILMMPSTTAFADTPTQSYEQTVTMDDVLKLKPYVIRNEDGTLVLDIETARIAGGKTAAIEALEYHFDSINPQIRSGEIATDDQLNIIGGEHLIKSHRCSSGTNSYTTYWWGYQRYDCNCETNRIISDLNTWAAGGTMVGGTAAGIAIVFPVTAEVAGIIAAGAAFDAGYWWLLATRMGANNNGNGTIINMTHVLVFDIVPQ